MVKGGLRYVKRKVTIRKGRLTAVQVQGGLGPVGQLDRADHRRDCFLLFRRHASHVINHGLLGRSGGRGLRASPKLRDLHP